MPKRIYVGNLPSGTVERDLRKMFSGFGDLISVIIYDPTGSRTQPGIRNVPLRNPGDKAAYVDLADDAAAIRAMTSLKNTTLGGNKLEFRID